MDDLLYVPESAAAAHRLALPSKYRASRGSSSGLLTKQSDGDGDDEENKNPENPSHCDRTILGSLDGEQDATTESTTVVSEDDHAMLMSAGATAAAAAATTSDGPVFLQAWQRLTEISAVKEPSLQRKQEFLQNENRKERVRFVDKEKEPEVGAFVTVQEREASKFRQRLKSCLHQRDAEQEWLADIFRRLVTYGNNNKEMILLTGPSGSGKTRLARAALQPLASESGGYFLWGKFDQLNLASPAPYTAFGSALGEFATVVANRGEDEVAKVRRAIRDALGSEASVLTRMIPGLEPLFREFQGENEAGGSSEGVGDGGPDGHIKTKSADAMQRFQRFVFVFRTFLRTVATPEHPMVLLLDDIHFADPCSLALLASIVTGHQSSGLVIVCTVDDRPENHPSYLSMRLKDIEDEGTVIQKMAISNLETDQVGDLLHQALSLPDGGSTVLDVHGGGAGDVASLARIVMQQTRGNPSDVIEFLCWLRDTELLYVDVETSRWTWDAEEIEMTIDTRQVGDFLVDKLEQLPQPVKDVLKVSACLGSHLNPLLLEYVLSVNVEPALRVAGARGALAFDQSRDEYYFDHDGIQAAAYSLIPEGDRELFHLEIGRRMWRRLDERAVDRHLFMLLSQMNIGRRLITRERERIAVATLCLHAGIKAARCSTFRTAVIYLDFGLSLLGIDGWRQHYDLALALHNAGAEMTMCTSDFERSNELVESVLKNAKILSDKTQAYATRIYALGAMDRQRTAIETGFEVLAGLGEPMTSTFSRRAVRSELRAINQLLRGKSDEQLLRMPLMTDKNKLACLQILNLIFLSSLMACPEYNPFVTLRMVRITMKYGASVFAASSFAYYGMLLINEKHDIENAFRYGSLGEKFLVRFDAHEFVPRVHAAFYGCIYPFRKPVKDVVCPLSEGYKVGMQTGDMEGAYLCMNLYCLNALEAGASVMQIEREWDFFRESMQSSRYTSFLKMAILHLQTLHHLSGKTDDPLASKGDLLDYDKELPLAKSRRDFTTYLALSMTRMILGFYFNDLDLAAKHLGALKFLKKMPPTLKKITAAFYGGLILIACAREGKKRRANLRFARWITKIMDYLATQTPYNCLDKLFLLEAEYASATGRNDVANKKYICAVGMAKDAGFPMYAALGYELWSRHLYRTGDRIQSRSFLLESCRLNREVGILRKVERLEEEIRQLFPDADATRGLTALTSSNRGAVGSSSSEQPMS